MNRLTIRVDACEDEFEDIIFGNDVDPEGEYNIMDVAKYASEEWAHDILADLAVKMAAYEDTGLSPEEVAEFKEKQEAKKCMGLPQITDKVTYCPTCKTHLMIEPQTRYCRWCGQKLDWD